MQCTNDSVEQLEECIEMAKSDIALLKDILDRMEVLATRIKHFSMNRRRSLGPCELDYLKMTISAEREIECLRQEYLEVLEDGHRDFSDIKSFSVTGNGQKSTLV